MRKEVEKRALKAHALRKQGLSFKEIGRKIGRLDDQNKPVTAERARHVYRTGKYILKRKEYQKDKTVKFQRPDGTIHEGVIVDNNRKVHYRRADIK